MENNKVFNVEWGHGQYPDLTDDERTDELTFDDFSDEMGWDEMDRQKIDKLAVGEAWDTIGCLQDIKVTRLPDYEG